MNWITKFLTWLGLHYQPRKPEKKPRKAPVQREKMHYGAHYYLSDLLDEIDNTFKGMDALKKADKGSYDIFSKIAFHVADSNLFAEHGYKNHWCLDVDQIPSYGGINITRKIHDAYMSTLDSGNKDISKKEKEIVPQFIMFRRIKRPVNVQPTNNFTLELGFLYIDHEFPNMPPWVDLFYVDVDQTGHMRPLKSLVPEVVNFRKNKYFVRRRWKFPDFTIRYCRKNNLDMTEYVNDITWYAINIAKSVDTGIQVRVGKGKKRVTFAIDMLRTPYFFNDREKVVNENGQTKKIFHLVRAHERKMANGKIKIIKSHTKGLRKFKWNGYDVNIFIAGKHSFSANDLTSDVHHFADDEIIPAKMIKEEDFARDAGAILDRS